MYYEGDSCRQHQSIRWTLARLPSIEVNWKLNLITPSLAQVKKARGGRRERKGRGERRERKGRGERRERKGRGER